MAAARPLLRRAVFLDRDGTLNVDLKYISEPGQIELYKGVAQGLRLLASHGFLLVVVSNQSGISRGYYTREAVESIHKRLQEVLAKEGLKIDRFYYCPHAPSDGCSCRKPGIELFNRAAQDLSIHLPSSAIIGDKPLDIEAGRKLGLLTALVRNQAFRVDLDVAGEYSADIDAPSFLAACESISARG
jgi:D-glycero-D-manno-heptose 1,7-bisphosphate phosphatase